MQAREFSQHTNKKQLIKRRHTQTSIHTTDMPKHIKVILEIRN